MECGAWGCYRCSGCNSGDSSGNSGISTICSADGDSCRYNGMNNGGFCYCISYKPERQDRFDAMIEKCLGTPNSGSAKERTMLHAMETGKIQSGEAKRRGLRKERERLLGKDIDVSMILDGGHGSSALYPNRIEGKCGKYAL